MLKKIYHELVAIRKELQVIRGSLEPTDKFVLTREPYSTRYTLIRVGCEETKKSEGLTNQEWRRFELTTKDEHEKARLEKILHERGLSRQDLAIILFGLRVRSGFGKEDFGI